MMEQTKTKAANEKDEVKEGHSELARTQQAQLTLPQDKGIMLMRTSYLLGFILSQRISFLTFSVLGLIRSNGVIHFDRLLSAC